MKEVDEWHTTVCSMTQCKVEGKVTSSLKVGNHSILGWLFDRVDLTKLVLNQVKCLSVRAYERACVRPSTKSFFNLNEIGVKIEVDEWCMVVCSMTRSKVKVMQWAISAFQDNGNNLEATTSTCFQLTTLALTVDTDWYSPPAPPPQWHVKKTPPPTKLQIPATVTRLPLTLILWDCRNREPLE